MENGNKKNESVLESSIAVVKISGSFNKDLNWSSKEAKNNVTKERQNRGSFRSPFNLTADDAKTNMVTGNYISRFNPFNRNVDDDDMSVSMASEITSIGSDDSGDISLAELGLTEDYFAHPEGRFGMSTVEELEIAIDNCKGMILELPENSSKRKKIVKKIVELRIKLQELREGPEEIEPKIKLVLGHKLRKRNSSSIKYYCDACNNLIWGVLQVWYRCKACGFNCHSKCVNNIQRKCVAVGLSNITYILDICPEMGLSAQHYRCVECKNPISIEGSKDEARLCDYNGQYFCAACHWNDVAVIPARVLHNWDFAPRKVSRRSFQLLSRMSKRSILNVQEINPMLFNYVEELADIRKLREDILLMKVYLTTCVNALDKKLLLLLKERQHFVDDSSTYSLLDLMQIQEGILTHQLTDIHATIARHIKFDCLCCQAKGFICEICNSGETLFPFDMGVATCGNCKAVFHRDCFTCIDTLCPRCERKQRKKLSVSQHRTLSSNSNSNSISEDESVSSYLKEDVTPSISQRQSTPNNSTVDVTEKLKQIKITNREMQRKSLLRDFMQENPKDFHVLGFSTEKTKTRTQHNDSYNNSYSFN